MNTLLIPDVYWVGAVDWNVRDFHGYQTDRGSTYNAYVIRDERSVLIDTVKAPFADVLLRNVNEVLNLSSLTYVVCNHAEPDHSGSLSAVMSRYPQAELVCNAKCKDALSRHYDVSGWKFKVVADGDTLSLGRKTLAFADTPMAHWPESMVTYLTDDRLLFSMDAFGQHYASSERFDDHNAMDEVMAEAKTYYANILMLYGQPVGRAMDKLANLKIDMIAPSHGIVWRTHIPMILSAYRDWTVGKMTRKALVIYDTMWQSTDRMAQAIAEGAAQTGAETKLFAIRSSSLTVLATEVMDAAAIACGSPSLNSTLMPQMAAVLTYLKGLKPINKAGFAFGSYGWAKGGVLDVEAYMKAMKFDLLREPLLCQFAPTSAILNECREAGRQLGERALKASP